jgi:hypothetical protein
MSHVVLVCCREANHKMERLLSDDNIDKLSRRIIPDNIEPHPPKVTKDKNITTIIINPVSSVLIKNQSVCLGMMLKPPEEWWKPTAEVPEGSFALFRADSEYVELLTDMCATRTIWYIKTDSFFIASSSQRAIVHFLQDFQPNLHALLWTITAGCSGPGFSWDNRIESMMPDSKLTLHRATWKLEIETNPVVFQIKKHNWKSAKETLLEALSRVFENLELDFSKWALPLSGGHDSRTILYFLRDKKEMRCITWGISGSLEQRHSDAQVAKALADRFHFKHAYYPTDVGGENVSADFDRSIYATEGRSATIGAYEDGLRMWEHLFKEGIEGIIRGDEAFGVFPVSSELEAHYNNLFTTWEDYRNLQNLVEKNWEIAKQQYIPNWLQPRANESLATWRDRMYQTYRIPYFLYGSFGRVCSYVENIEPLLTRTIVNFARTLPDKFRTKTEKSLFNDIANNLIPDIPRSKYESRLQTKTVLRNEKIISHIVNTLNENKSSGYLPVSLIEFTLSKLKQDQRAKARVLSLKDLAKKAIPKRVRVVLRGTHKGDLDYHVLASRIFVVIRANQMFRDDAHAFSS